jgi:ABC-type nitrate/sulfonate/bicarbonate transport system substrate-binding protein
VIVNRSYLNEHRDAVTRFVRAYVTGAYLALSNETRAKEVIAKTFKTQDPKVIDATYLDFKRIMPLDAAPSLDGAKSVIAQLQALGIDVGSKDVNDHLDLSIIDGLKQAGTFTRLGKSYPLP